MRAKKTNFNDPCRCENCAHFFQHYILTDKEKQTYIRIFYGHCTTPRVKKVTPESTCELFTPADPPRT